MPLSSLYEFFVRSNRHVGGKRCQFGRARSFLGSRPHTSAPSTAEDAGIKRHLSERSAIIV